MTCVLEDDANEINDALNIYIFQERENLLRHIAQKKIIFFPLRLIKFEATKWNNDFV